MVVEDTNFVVVAVVAVVVAVSVVVAVAVVVAVVVDSFQSFVWLPCFGKQLV